MNSYSDYLIYCIPLIFIVLSHMYKLKFNRLKGTGKVTYIIGAKQRQTLFLALAILSALIIIITKFDFFSQSEYPAL